MLCAHNRQLTEQLKSEDAIRSRQERCDRKVAGAARSRKGCKEEGVAVIAQKNHELVQANNELRISTAIVQNQLNARTLAPPEINNTLW